MLTGHVQLVRWSLQSCVTELKASASLVAWQSRSSIVLHHARHTAIRQASSSTSRWLARQNKDPFTRASKTNALKSRAAYKLLEIDQKHRIFRPGQTVVDLGYAPGSWSQVAISRVRGSGSKSEDSAGRVVGIDVIPAQPPRGVSTIQGDFLSAATRERVVEFVRNPQAGRPKNGPEFACREDNEQDAEGEEEMDVTAEDLGGQNADTLPTLSKSRQNTLDEEAGRVVDVVLSDMSEPWPMANIWANSVVNPYRRMMNTSGNAFRDHAGSMDLCLAALSFAFDTLKTGGTFLCKYYQGGEDKQFEMRLKAMFDKVHRIKPDSSRKESREAYFLALQRKPGTIREQVFDS